MSAKSTTKKSSKSIALIALLLLFCFQLTAEINVFAQTKPSPAGSQASGEQDPQGKARNTEDTVPDPYADALGQTYQVPEASEQNIENIKRGVTDIITGKPNSPLVFQAGEQGRGNIIQRAADNVGNFSMGDYNETYEGLHQWFKDDLVGNLFRNIGELIGQWLSEFINGWIADTVRFLAQFLRVFVLNPNIATNGLNGSQDDGISKYVREGADIMYGIAVDLLLLLFILCIWKFWADAAWRGGSNLMGSVGRLIFTAGLMLAWPTLYAFEIQITNEMIKEIYFNSSDQVFMLDYALAAAVKGGVIAAGAGATSVFAPLLANLAIPVAGAYVGQLFYFASIVIFTILGGILIAELIYILVLKAIQTALLTAQYMFAPIFIVFFATPDTENVCSGFFRSFVETSLWTFVWVGLLKVMVIILFSDYNPWGKILIAVGVLQLMIQVPSFLARAQISPMSDFISAGLLTGGAMKFMSGVGGAVTGLTDKGINWWTNERFGDRGLQTHKAVELNGLALENSNPTGLNGLNTASANGKQLATQGPGATPPLRVPGTGVDPTVTPGTGPGGAPLDPALNGGTGQPLVTPGTGNPTANPAGVPPVANPAAGVTAPINTTPIPVTPGPNVPLTSAGAAAVAAAAVAVGTGLAGAQANAVPDGQPKQHWQIPVTTPEGMSEPNMFAVPGRQLAGATLGLEVGISTNQNADGVTGSVRGGVQRYGWRKGATDSEKAHAFYAAAYTNQISMNDVAQDAAREAAVEAGANKPQTLAEGLAANWLSNTGGSWNRTAMSKQRFQQAMFEQAALGSQAYVSGDANHPNRNAYTNYLESKYGDWDQNKDALAEHIVMNTGSTDSVWNLNRKTGFEACSRSGTPWGTATIGAMQNFEIQKLHPSRQKEGAFAVLSYAFDRVSAEYPDMSTTEAQLALAETARNMPGSEVNSVLSMYQVSGQADLNQGNVGYVQSLAASTGKDEKTSYACAAAAMPHVARALGRVSQNANFAAARTITDVEQMISGDAHGETHETAVQTVKMVTANLLKNGQANGIDMTTVLNQEVAPAYYDFMRGSDANSNAFRDLSSPSSQRKLQIISHNAKLAGTSGDTQTLNAILEVVDNGGNLRNMDTDHVLQARARYIESNGNHKITPQLIECDLATRAADSSAALPPIADMVKIAEPFARNQATDYRLTPVIAQMVGNNVPINQTSIRLAAEVVQDNKGGWNEEQYSVMVRVAEALRNPAAASAVFEVAARETLSDRGVADASNIDMQSVLQQLGPTGISSVANRIVDIQRKGSFSSYQMQDSTLVNVLLEEDSRGASAPRMQAINVISHVMGSESVADSTSVGTQYIDATSQYLQNSKPGAMRDVTQDVLYGASAVQAAQTSGVPGAENLRINYQSVRSAIGSADWRGNATVLSQDTIEAMVRAQEEARQRQGNS